MSENVTGMNYSSKEECGLRVASRTRKVWAQEHGGRRADRSY